MSVTRRSLLEWVRGWAQRRPGRAALALAAAASLFFLVMFVGVQVWADQALAQKAFKAIAADEAAIVDIDRQLRALGRDRTDGGPEVASLHREPRDEPDAPTARSRESGCPRRQAALHQHRQRPAGPGSQARGSRPSRAALANKSSELAKALASTVLERVEADVDSLDYSAADTDRLRTLLAEADAALAQRTTPEP